MMLLVGALLVLFGWIAALFLLADGVRNVRRCRHAVPALRARTLLRGIVSLTGAIWLGLLAWVAAALAETVNGSHDVVDINGGSWGVHMLVVSSPAFERCSSTAHVRTMARAMRWTVFHDLVVISLPSSRSRRRRRPGGVPVSSMIE